MGKIEPGEMKLLTVGEVARILRVSKMTVYRMANCGDLACVRIGRSYRIADREVARYLSAAFPDGP